MNKGKTLELRIDLIKYFSTLPKVTTMFENVDYNIFDIQAVLRNVESCMLYLQRGEIHGGTNEERLDSIAKENKAMAEHNSLILNDTPSHEVYQ
jgi:hypothetical protein